MSSELIHIFPAVLTSRIGNNFSRVATIGVFDLNRQCLNWDIGDLCR